MYLLYVTLIIGVEYGSQGPPKDVLNTGRRTDIFLRSSPLVPLSVAWQ